MASLTNDGDLISLLIVARGEDILVSVTGTYDVILFQRESGSRGSGIWQTLHTFNTQDGTETFRYVSFRDDEFLRAILTENNSGTATVTVADDSVKDLPEAAVIDASGIPLLTFDQDGAIFPGDLDVGDDLAVAGDSAVTGDETVGGTLDVTGAQTVGGTLGVTGAQTIGGTLGLTGALTSAAMPITTLGVGAVNGASVAAVEQGDGVLHQTVLTLTATPITMADDAAQGQYGGVKIYDFPLGSLMILGVVCDGDFTAVEPWLDTWAGDMALGTAAPTDAQSTEAGEDNIQQLTATGTASALVAAIDASLQVAAVLTESGARWFNGTDTAVDLYLNMITDDDDGNTATTAAMLFTGTITITWINLGTIAA